MLQITSTHLLIALLYLQTFGDIPCVLEHFVPYFVVWINHQFGY